MYGMESIIDPEFIYDMAMLFAPYVLDQTSEFFKNGL